MRKGVLHWESSPCRLLPLLLVILLSIIGLHSVHGSFGNKKKFNITKEHLSRNEGGSTEGLYRVYNRCSERQIQVRPGGRMRRNRKKGGSRKGRVDAKAKADSIYSKLIFESTGESIYIKSEYLKRYICFNKRGRIVLRRFIRHHKENADLCSFKQKKAENDDLYHEFQSAKNRMWYLGFNKRGRKYPPWKRGNRPKCFNFLVREDGVTKNYSPLDKTNFRNKGPFSSKKR